MAKGNISRKMKKINGKSLSGDGNLLLGRGLRKVRELTLTEGEHEITIDTDDTGNSFILEKAIVFVFAPQAENTSGGYIRIKSRYVTGIGDDPYNNANYGVVSFVNNASGHDSRVEITTNDEIYTYAVISDADYSSGVSNKKGNMATNFGSVHRTHKQIEGIRMYLSLNEAVFPAGTKIMVLGVDK